LLLLLLRISAYIMLAATVYIVLAVATAEEE
jgi:hypothetical protein